MRGVKLCIFCDHCRLDLGDYGYSEYTPGGPGEFSCWKGVWNIQFDSDKDYRELISHAETCEHFLYYKDA
jgi:hypothetical protein